MTTLYQAVACSRLSVESARGELIEALGDWMCGSGVPPSLEKIESLARLCEAQEKAEAEYARHVAVLSNALGTGTNQLQPGAPYSSAAAGGAFGVFNSTVSKDVGLGAQRQIQFSLRYNL